MRCLNQHGYSAALHLGSKFLNFSNVSQFFSRDSFMLFPIAISAVSDTLKTKCWIFFPPQKNPHKKRDFDRRIFEHRSGNEEEEGEEEEQA